MRKGSIVGLVVGVVVATVIGCVRSAGASTPARPSPGHLIVGKAISLPPALFKANPVGSPSLISPSQADDVVRAMWELWESALVASNTRALSQLVAPGPLLQGTINNCALPDGHCVFDTSSRPILGLQTIVPLQRAYPLYFLAEVRTTEYVNTPNGLTAKEAWVELQVLTKAAAQKPWTLSFDSGYTNADGSPAPFLGFDLAAAGPATATGGQEQYNPAAQRAPPVPAKRFLPLLAAYWQSYKNTGRAPAQSAFVTAGYASAVGRQQAQNRQGSVYAGHRDTFRFSAEPGAGAWQFSAYGGYPMICGDVRNVATFVPLKKFLYQNPDESNYGIPLRSGYYRKIITTAEHATCVYVEPAGLEAAGNTVLASKVTGVFAKNAPGQTNGALSDLETDYGVLAYQLAHYSKQLRVCVHRHASAACSKPFAMRAEQEFALFERRLASDNFPATARGDVDRLAATARRLTRLFEQLTTTAPTVAIFDKIVDGIATLNRQYKTLVHKLS